MQGKEGFLFAINNDTFFEINQKINSDYLNGYFSIVFVSLDESLTSTLSRILNLMMEEYQTRNRLVLMESYMQSFLFHIVFLDNTVNLNNNRNVVQFIELIKLIDRHFFIHLYHCIGWMYLHNLGRAILGTTVYSSHWIGGYGGIVISCAIVSDYLEKIKHLKYLVCWL